MTLNKKCTCCKSELTTKTVSKLGIQEGTNYDLLIANCKSCKSTVAIARRNKNVVTNDIIDDFRRFMRAKRQA